MCSQIQDLLHSILAPSARATSRVEESATCATAVLAGCIRSVLISKMLDSTKGRKIGHARPAVPPLLHHPHNHLQLPQRPASPRMTRSTAYSSTRTELVTSYQSWNAFWRNSNTGIQAHIQVTEPSHPELHNSTTGPSTRPRRRTTDLHSQVDQLPPTAPVTRDSI